MPYTLDQIRRAVEFDGRGCLFADTLGEEIPGCPMTYELLPELFIRVEVDMAGSPCRGRQMALSDWLLIQYPDCRLSQENVIALAEKSIRLAREKFEAENLTQDDA